MVPALYLNIYNLQMLPLILSFILLMCFICLNSYLAFPAIKQQGLWPVFHSSHADPIDLTLICRIFHCIWTNANMQKDSTLCSCCTSRLSQWQCGGTPGLPSFPKEQSKAHPCQGQHPRLQQLWALRWHSHRSTLQWACKGNVQVLALSICLLGVFACWEF